MQGADPWFQLASVERPTEVRLSVIALKGEIRTQTLAL